MTVPAKSPISEETTAGLGIPWTPWLQDRPCGSAGWAAISAGHVASGCMVVGWDLFAIAGRAPARPSQHDAFSQASFSSTRSHAGWLRPRTALWRPNVAQSLFLGPSISVQLVDKDGAFKYLSARSNINHYCVHTFPHTHTYTLP